MSDRVGFASGAITPPVYCKVCGADDGKDSFERICLQDDNLLVIQCRSCGYAWAKCAGLGAVVREEERR